MSDTIDRLAPAWIIIDGDFCTYSCEDHAREYAETNGIPASPGDSYSIERDDYGLTADVYPVHSWDSYETDYPVACDCGRYLAVDLTNDGREYMIEHGGFPAWLMAAHGIES